MAARNVLKRAAASDGMTIIELMVAILILAVGILATFAVYSTSNRATHVSEFREAATHQAQLELERLEALPYNKLGLTGPPARSTNQANPGFYVSGSSGCPSFQWDQASGTTHAAEQVVVNGCSYNGTTFTGGSTPTTQTSGVYTIYDYVTWVNDSLCLPNVGCPINNDYKRITVEVTTSSPTGYGPATPVLVTAVMTDPHALPIVGNPNVNNPLNNPTVWCTDGNGNQVQCNYGLGNQTPNTYYLTNTPEQNSSYSPPTGDNSCMHYTNQKLPLSLAGQFTCGGTNLLSCSSTSLTSCPEPDLLNNAPPPSSIIQEYNFSPNLSASAAGRVILRDPSATGSTPAAACGATPSNDASMGEFWGTKPLGTQLSLSGNGGMTLYTNTLHGSSANVTLCVGLYLESPVQGILDPLNILGNDSIKLGVAAYTSAQWPAVLTPLSFTFNNLFTAQAAAAGTSLGVRVWVTASSGDDIVVQYDAPTAASSVQINSQ